MRSELIVCIGEAQYIYPANLLNFLAERVRLLAEKAAEPGLEPFTTERIRGQRVEALTTLKIIEEALNG
jgi:hypothetical protein